MNRKAGFFSGFILILLIVALVFSGYYIYQNFPRESIPFKSFNLEETNITDNTLPSKQFYLRMRYQDKVINYNIADTCSTEKATSMKEALDTIDSLTVLSFKPVSKANSVLNILCSDISPEAEEENHFVAGEGGPSRVLDSKLYSVILEGKIALYREETCKNSNVATHELLHALGFDHNNNKKSILYPTLDCDQKIDDEIIESINKLYKDESLPDLVFSTANASKGGKYLNFHIEVLNQGLQPSKAINVSIYADGVFVETFELKEISIGAKKILDVENLKIPLNSKKIEFVIDAENKVPEIYENNNKITLNTI